MPVMGDKKLGLGGDVQYSSKYLTLLGLAKVRPHFYQKSFFKLNTNISLTGADDAWELAFVGNNLTNKIVTHTQGSAAIAGGLFFVGGITGGSGKGLGGLDETLSQAERGRELWIRLTVRFGN
jgi:outer membrane receptor protein involved in Fe transport